MRQPKLGIVARSALIALASPLAMSLPAVAQQVAAASQANDQPQLEQVTVTARRTKERLQDVPTAVTAISAKDLEDLKIDGFQAVGQTVPNLYVQKQGGSPATPQMQIRGVSNGSLNMQVDSGIGLYVDGVYIGRPGTAAFELADLERVEVLRGPQGTLFGRNATGGAINLITASPGGAFGGNIEVGFGNFGQQRAKVRIDTDVWNGLSARLTVGHTKIDGPIANTAPKATYSFNGPLGPYSSLTTNERGGDSQTDAAMLALHYQGASGLKLDYKADYTDWKGTLDYRHSADLDANNKPIGFDFPTAGLYVPLEGTATNKVHGQSFVAEYAINKSLSAKYIGGFRGYAMVVPGNQVFGESGTTSLGGGNIGTKLFAKRQESQRQTSHEIQLIGNVDNVEWIGGLFSFEETGGVNGPILFGTAFGGGPIGANNTIDPAFFNYFLGQDVKVNNKSTAGYVHATWHAGPVDLSGGVRSTHDDRLEYITAGGLIGTGSPGTPASGQTFKYGGSHTDYDVSASYKIDNDANVYAKYATGYVSGGTLLGTTFGPEGMKAVELGLKTTTLDQRLRLGVALFDQRRKDSQIEYFDSNSGGYLMGKGTGKSSGVELEANYAATKAMSLNMSYGYVDAKNSGDLVVTQPKQTMYLGGEYKFDRIGGVRPTLRIDASYHTDYATMKCLAGYAQDPGKDTCHVDPSLTPAQLAALPALQAAARIPAGTQLSARLTFAELKLFGDNAARVSLWGRNLLDEKHIEYNFGLGGTTIANTYQRPRSYGVDLSFDF